MTYRLREDVIWDEGGKPYTVYGIEAIQPETKKQLSVPDVFFDKEKAIAFVRQCNELEVAPVHLADVVDNILAAEYSGK